MTLSEWSFVAVPAQRSAGVIKSFKGKEMKMEEILKSIYTEKDINLSGEECKKLCSYIDELKKSAADGVYYRDTALLRKCLDYRLLFSLIFQEKLWRALQRV